MQQRPQEQDKLGVNLFPNSHYWTPESIIYPKSVFLVQHPLHFPPYLPGQGCFTNLIKTLEKIFLGSIHNSELTPPSSLLSGQSFGPRSLQLWQEQGKKYQKKKSKKSLLSLF